MPERKLDSVAAVAAAAKAAAAAGPAAAPSSAAAASPAAAASSTAVPAAWRAAAPAGAPKPIANPVERRFETISKYHYYAYGIFFLSKIPAFWHLLNLIFLNANMSYTCGGAKNACPCSNPKWDRSVFTETVASKFDLICDQKYLIHLMESLGYFGMLIGAMTFGIISDKLGRLTGYCISNTFCGLMGIVLALAPSYTLLTVAKFLEGVGTGGMIVTSFVICIEYTGPRFRETITALYLIPITLGHLTLVGISYVFRDYSHFEIAISIPVFIFGMAFLYVSDSPLWLLDNNKQEKTIKIMEKIARWDNKTDPTIRAEVEAYCANKTQNKVKTIQLYHIFKYRILTINFVCMSYMYFVCGMGYYGVSQYISKMSDDVHANTAISALITMPGTLSSVVLLNKMGRKPLLMMSNILAGIFMIIAVLMPATVEPAWINVIIASLGLLSFFLAFIVVFLYGVEMFPTQVRNSVLGFLSLLSRAGMMSAPQINALSQFVAGLAFGIMALIGGFLTILLPETKNKKLPSTLEEAETMFRREKYSLDAENLRST